jgi:hypothetical protein
VQKQGNNVKSLVVLVLVYSPLSSNNFPYTTSSLEVSAFVLFLKRNSIRRRLKFRNVPDVFGITSLHITGEWGFISAVLEKQGVRVGVCCQFVTWGSHQQPVYSFSNWHMEVSSIKV